jgi:hypothetical protein
LPRRVTNTPAKTHQTLKNVSYESLVTSWLMHDGWQVYRPMLDHGHKTDLLISDGPNFHRIQIKSFESKREERIVTNCWSPCLIDCVVFMARDANWGVITPAFSQRQRPIKHKDHRKFDKNRREFLRAFHLV